MGHFLRIHFFRIFLSVLPLGGLALRALLLRAARALSARARYLGFALLALSVQASPMNSVFTYQGRLTDVGGVATGTYDLTFGLFDAASGGTQIGPICSNTVALGTDGVFSVALDFGAGAFDGNARWLAISVRTNGSGGFTTLYPRQPLTPAPYALYSPTAGSASVAAVANSVSSTASLPSQSVSSTNLVFSEALTLTKASIGDYGINRFAWTNTLARLAANRTLSVSLVGSGWEEDSEFGGFITNLLSRRPLAGYASSVVIYAPTLITYGPFSGNDTAFYAHGDDTNWHDTYFVLTNTGSITAPSTVVTSDVCNVQYLANPDAGSFVLEIRTNGAWPYAFTNLDSTWTTVATVNAANPTWEGKVMWWTNNVPVGTQLRVRATTPGQTPILGCAQWNSRITNGIILSQYSHQASGNWWTYTDTNKVFPIWAARPADMVILTGGWGDAAFSATVGTINLVRGGFPGADLIDCGVHLTTNPLPNTLERQFCALSGIPFFDGVAASIAAWGTYANGVSLGLYADTAHMTAKGYAAFSDLLWSWMGLDSFPPPPAPAIPAPGVTTNLSIGGTTLYITNGIIVRVSTP